MTSRTMAGAIAMVMFAACGTAVFAQGTQQQRDACTPDAFRLCGQFIPDAEKIEACLRRAGPKLSPPCRVVFNPPPPSVAQTPPGRDRASRNRAPAPLPSPPFHDDDDD